MKAPSLLIFCVLTCSFGSLSAIQWQQVDGAYVAPARDAARLAQALHDWREPLALIDLSREIGNQPQTCQLLPQELQNWLQRLGIIAQENGQISCHRPLSIVAVVHPHCRRHPNSSDFLWYRNDVRRGPAALKLFSLSAGQIDLLEPWDFRPQSDSPRVCSLPNGFVLRNFPNPHPEHGNEFWFHVSGARADEPLAYASLLLDSAGKAQVAIEIIPPSGTTFSTLGDLETLIRRFANARHPFWRQPSSSPYHPPAPNPERLAIRREHERSNFDSGGEAVHRIRQRFTRTVALCTTPEEAAALQNGDIPANPEVREVVHKAALGAAQEAVAVMEQTEQQIQTLAISASPTAPEEPQVQALQEQLDSLQLHVQHFCQIARETLPEPTPENPSPAAELEVFRPYTAGVDISLSEARRFLSRVMESFREMAREAKAIKDAVDAYIAEHVDTIEQITNVVDIIGTVWSAFDVYRVGRIFVDATKRYVRTSIRAAREGRARQHGDFFENEERIDLHGFSVGFQSDMADATGDIPAGRQSADSHGGDHDHGDRHDSGGGNRGGNAGGGNQGQQGGGNSGGNQGGSNSGGGNSGNEYHERNERDRDIDTGLGDGIRERVHEVREVHVTERTYHERVTRETSDGRISGHEVRITDRSPNESSSRPGGGNSGGNSGSGSNQGGGGNSGSGNSGGGNSGHHGGFHGSGGHGHHGGHHGGGGGGGSKDSGKDCNVM